MPHVRSLVVTCGNAGKKKASAASKLQSAASKKSLAYRVSRGGLTLEKIPQPLVERSPSVALAFTYLGDAVWELYARQHMILKRVTSSESASTSGRAIRPQDGVSKGWCSAKAMHAHLNRLLEQDLLTDQELAVLKWGRDFGHESRSGHKGDVHRDARALEALVAYLYLFESDRLHEVLELCGMTFCGKPLNGLVGIADATLETMDALNFDVEAVDLDSI